MCSLILKGQDLNSINNDTLKFKLLIFPVLDIDTKDTLKNVNLKILGTDGTLREYLSDSLGFFPMIELKPNTSYSLIVNKSKYLIAKGKETTVALTTSMNFIHEYTLQKLFICSPLLPHINFDYNSLKGHHKKLLYNSLEPFSEKEGSNLTNIYYEILTENPNIIMQINGFRDKSEKKKISKQRAEFYVAQLIKMGIDKERFVIADGGVRTNVDAQENRTINFKVISTDYIAK